MTSSRFTSEVLATRGDRLALERQRFELADGDVGPSESESLCLLEVNDHGDNVAVMFDPHDLDAAYAELDDRYAAGEAAPFAAAVAFWRAFSRAFARRDWDALVQLYAPDLVDRDHRPLGWETVRGSAAEVQTLRALVDLAPDVRMRIDHITLSDHATLIAFTWVGTREGGAFELPKVCVTELDDTGRYRSIDVYDLDQLDAARARFEAIGKGRPRDPPAALARPNAATAAMDRVQAAFGARDWSGMRALYSPQAVVDDRQRHILVSHAADRWIAHLEQNAQVADLKNWRYERRLLGTAGDRVDLERVLWTGSFAGGPFEIEHLTVTAVDEAGRIVAAVAFDVDDWRSAYTELGARWATGVEAAAPLRPISEFREGVKHHDHARIRAVLADDFVMHDHRRTGPGLLEGPDAYLKSVTALWGLAPDVQFDDLPLGLVMERYGSLRGGRLVGTLADGGGAFESVAIFVGIVSGGRISRIELFELEDVDAALARFAELRPDPLRIPPNAATRAGDRLQECIETQNWDALRALCAPVVWDDRRRLIRVTGDCDMLIANAKLISGARLSRTLLATSGDRLALERRRWTEAPGRPAFEIEFLHIFEVDAEGHVVAAISFDPDDRRAASMELLDRFARSDAARVVPSEFFALQRALLTNDLERIRAALPSDFVFDDHRRTGMGRLEGRDAYIAAMAALFEQAPDALVEPLYYIAVEKHGALAVSHIFGTLAEGGEFEIVSVLLGRFPLTADLFEIEDLDVARARLEELRPDPLRIPPNAACRARSRGVEGGAARDWAALRALASHDFVYEDRRKRALLTGDVELWIESLKFYGSTGLQYTGEPIATMGDRLALERCMFTGESDGVAVEIEFLVLTEIDATGRHVGVILFDPDDRRAAFEEAYARFLAGEAAPIGGQAPIVALQRAFKRRAWETLAACLAEDAVIHDRRAVGILGTLDRDQWVESLRTLADLSPDADGETVRILTWNRHGRVDIARQYGTRDGGPFETILVRVIVTDGDHIQRYEIFDVDAADDALARFAELCAEPTGIDRRTQGN